MLLLTIVVVNNNLPALASVGQNHKKNRADAEEPSVDQDSPIQDRNAGTPRTEGSKEGRGPRC